MTTRRAPLVVLHVLAAAVPAPAAASQSPAQLAAGVEREIVYVDPAASGRLTPQEAGQLRLRIVRRAIGRIKIVVAPASAGDAQGLAQAVAGRIDLRGALIAVSGREAAVVTSYESEAALRAVDGRVARDPVPELSRAIDTIAEADEGGPGPGGAGSAPDPGGSESLPIEDSANDFLDDLGDTVRTAFFAVAAAIILVLLVPLLVWGVRARRRRREGAEDLAAGCATARDELVAIGDLVRELDIDAEMPDAPQAGKDALARAIELYRRADRELAKATTRRRLQRAQATVSQARGEAELARRHLGGAPRSTAGLVE